MHLWAMVGQVLSIAVAAYCGIRFIQAENRVFRAATAPAGTDHAQTMAVG